MLINGVVSIKNQTIGVLAKKNPGTCYCGCHKACKIDNNLDDNKFFSYKKRLIGKLVLECEDEVLNKTEISPDNQKVIYQKNYFLIHTISLAVIYLLLIAVYDKPPQLHY